MNKQSTIARIAWAVCILVGVVLSLKALREPDLWWMYRTGEWMLENGEVTKSDPFSYTFAGVEWINVKWFFEVLITLGKNCFGVEFIFVFQAMVTLLILTFFYQSANLIKQHTADLSDYQKKPFAGLILTGFLLLFTIDYRLIGRPEMTSHAMVAAYLFLFWRYYYQPSKLILLLIPLQMLWTNMHEAFGTGMVLMVAYLGASWVQYFYAQKKGQSPQLPQLLSIAVLGALAVVVINPRGYQMWLHPFEIFSQLDNNQYTTELASIWKAAYWEKQAYLNLLFLGGSLLFVALVPFIYRKVIPPASLPSKPSNHQNKKGKKTSKVATATPIAAPLDWLNTNIQKFGLGNGLLFFMLFYLSTTAYRNIPFFVLAAAPIMAVAVDAFFHRIKAAKWIYPLLLAGGLFFYGSIITGKYHQWTSSRDTYGLQVLSSHNPTGATQFIEKHHIKGTCFSDYLTSAYLLWKLQPNFKTYIDLRDLDIFPTSFFADFAKTTALPSEFDAKDDSLNFDYVVLFRPKFSKLHKHLLASDNYDLVFVDPVACIYLKNTPQHQSLIAQYGFTANGNKDIFSELVPIKSATIPYLISKLFNPLYSPTDYTETDENAIAGSYYLSLKQTNLAFNRAKASIQSGVEPWKGHELLGNIYNNSAFNVATTDSLRQSYIQQASYQYSQAINAKPDYISAIVGKATLSMQQQNFRTAIHLFNQALVIDPNYAQAIQYLGMCYKILANQNGQDPINTQQWLNYSLRLDRLNPNNPYILLDIGIAYCSLGNCSKAVEYLKNIMEVPGLPPEEFKTAARCMKKCS
ncbi:tetratricopeptide repeat protein [Aureispira anguillae]|uniref:Cytochrome C biosynthesis protein n=1 Tax=Aureispira anguillae TaxID=2864201 RepID=A0A915YJX6_9BACT|nr:cytochrome C biosynthesis protein [Aureispira anguillae]BDS14468.1 cytochrome C biosynthesis protein [Aureispira anguillae]